MFSQETFFGNLENLQFQKCNESLKNQKEWYLKLNKIITFQQFYFDLQFDRLQTFEMEDKEINLFIQIKKDLIMIYKTLKFQKFNLILKNIENLKTNNVPLNLKKNFDFELSLLESFILSEKYLHEFLFKEFLFQLYSSKNIFIKWIDSLEPKNEPQIERKLTMFESLFYSSEKINPENKFKQTKLFQFYSQSFDSLISKSCLLFNNFLNLENLKKGFEHINSIQTFHQTYSIHTISFIYNTKGIPIELNGYSFEKLNQDDWKGIKSLPCIFCFPKKKSELMISHWPNITSIILSMFDQEYQEILDKKSSYFVMNINDNVYMIITLECSIPKGDKRCRTFYDFMLNLKNQLNHQKIYSLIK